MSELERRRLAEQVAARLLAAAATGRDAGAAVPSCRELAKTMQVSVPTAMAALRSLAERGHLAKVNETGRYRWLKTPAVQQRDEGRRLLLIRPPWSSEINAMSRQAMDRLLYEAAVQGWATHQEMLPYGTERKRADARFEAAVERFRPTRIVVALGTGLVASWAVGCGVPVLFFGGSAGPYAVPVLGVSMSASLRNLLPRLLAAGERHICLPICGYHEDFIVAFRNAFGECLSAAGLPYVASYHTPATVRYGPAALRGLLEPVMAARLPTTVIFTGMRHYLAAFRRLEDAGLQPGKNLKVAILTNEPEIDWVEPQPAHFRLPVEPVHRRLTRWLLAPNAAIFQRGPLHLPAAFVPGCGID